MRNGPYELIVAPAGYPGVKYRGRYAYEHIVVWWRCHGIVPAKGYEIHHKNMNHRDNRISNLQLVTSSEHRKLHGRMQSKLAERIVKCEFCSKEIKLRRSIVEWKKRVGRRSFCSRRCIGKMMGRGRVLVRPQSC